MDKLTMAHEYVMNYMASPDCKDTTVSNIVSVAWSYADLMQDEADKRNYPEKQDSSEWQPDWSQAPDNMVYFAVDKNGSGWFFNREPLIETDNCWYCGDDSTELDNHNYQGNWQESLRKRPQ